MAVTSPVQNTQSVRDTQITYQGGGVQTAPTAGTVIATCTVNNPGLYEVVVNAAIGAGTAVIGDVGNMNVKQNTTTLAVLATPLNGNILPVTMILSCAAGDAIKVTAVGNATSGVGYSATIVARYCGSN